MPVSIRLDRESEEMLKKVADSRHTTRSEAVRNAIKSYYSTVAEEDKKTPWEVYKTVHATGGSGHGARVSRSRETLKKILEDKRRQW